MDTVVVEGAITPVAIQRSVWREREELVGEACC